LGKATEDQNTKDRSRREATSGRKARAGRNKETGLRIDGNHVSFAVLDPSGAQNAVGVGAVSVADVDWLKTSELNGERSCAALEARESK
jgi:hypothetical protein